MKYSTRSSPTIALLPKAPINGSPVPWLTSLYHKSWRGNYGDSRYPGNCSGELIKDLLKFFGSRKVFDPMTGSGTCADVCRELDIACVSQDIHRGFDACDPDNYKDLEPFDFVWIHPPYWRMKQYSSDTRDLCNAATLEEFLTGYQQLITNCASVLQPGGKLAVLMGDYTDRQYGFVPLVYHTQRLAFATGLKQHCTQIVRFSHGASSSTKTYRSAFIPGLHDILTVFEMPN